MSNNSAMSLSQLAKELDMGRPMLKFLVNRFSRWFPHHIEKGQKQYQPEALKELLFIIEKIESGFMPSEVEAALTDRSVDAPGDQGAEIVEQDLPGTRQDPIRQFEAILNTLNAQQERIAKSHERRADAEEKKAAAIERRAEAEERKAAAIEKRAEAEIKKAEAMNNIAISLQNMRHEIFPGSRLNSLAGDAVTAIALDEFRENSSMEPNELTPEPDTAEPDAEPDAEKEETPTSLKENLDLKQSRTLDDPDDLSLLISNGQPSHGDEDGPANIDDLSILVDDNNKTSMENETIDTPLDDLALLLEENRTEPTIDNLSSLLRIADTTATDIDNLTGLLDETSDLPSQDKTDPMDNLSQLLEKEPQPVDDLALLLDNPQGERKNSMDVMDDLSLLVEGKPQPDAGLDDLSESGVATKTKEMKLKPDITPGENLEAYKDEIISIIIRLKKDGLTVEETTEKLNGEGIVTLSGKPRWSTKAIAQIYKFIAAVAH